MLHASPDRLRSRPERTTLFRAVRRLAQDDRRVPTPARRARPDLSAIPSHAGAVGAGRLDRARTRRAAAARLRHADTAPEAARTRRADFAQAPRQRRT